MTEKDRLDRLLVAQGLASDPDQAARLILAGRVRVDGQPVLTPSAVYPKSVRLALEARAKYVSRGGEKLEAALKAFGVQVAGAVCADVGASTGGFTDCLLQHGAQRVYAIDVGRGILDWRLRQNPNVIVMENTNARQLQRLPTPVQIVTLDVSFISLKILLPVVRGWLAAPAEAQTGAPAPAGTVLALIKPQFEASRRQADRARGVIRDPAIHRQVLLEVLGRAVELGYGVRGLIASPLPGAKGNREFFAWLVLPGMAEPPLEALIAAALG